MKVHRCFQTFIIVPYENTLYWCTVNQLTKIHTNCGCVHTKKCYSTKKKKAKGRASKGKGLTTSAWLPQFDPQNPHKGGQRELTPQNWPLTSISTTRHVHMHPHAYTLIHTVKRKSIIDKTMCVVYVYLCVCLCIRIWRPVVNIRCFFSLAFYLIFWDTVSHKGHWFG